MRYSPEELAAMLKSNPDLLAENDYRSFTQYDKPGVEGELSEHQEQVRIMKWVHENEPRFPELEMMFAVPNGGKRDARTGKMLKDEGVKRGVPDLWLPVRRGDYVGLVIENKVGKNKTSAYQDWWLERLDKQGWMCVVCYTAEDAIEAVKEYLSVS